MKEPCGLGRCQVGEELANHRFKVDDFLLLLDATGRAMKAAKRGRIPPELGRSWRGSISKSRPG